MQKKQAACLILIIFALASSAYFISRSTTYQLFGEIIPKVSVQKKVVALTFDDGPAPKYLDQVLRELEQTGVQATFFLVGEAVKNHPELVRNIEPDGHEIGNHSYSHPRMILMPTSQVATEIEKTDLAIREAGYDGPIHFRPPFGKKLIVLPRYLSQQNRPSIMWSLAPDNWKSTPEDRIARVRAEIEPGSIILLHVMYQSGDVSRAILRPMIEALKADGYDFVTISQLLSLRTQ